MENCNFVSMREAATAAGISYSVLESWILQGLFEDVARAPGRGKTRLFSQCDIERLKRFADDWKKRHCRKHKGDQLQQR